MYTMLEVISETEIKDRKYIHKERLCCICEDNWTGGAWIRYKGCDNKEKWDERSYICNKCYQYIKKHGKLSPEYLKESNANRMKCCKCGKEGTTYKDYDSKGVWTGRWWCRSCWTHDNAKNNPDSFYNVTKSMRPCRNKGIDKDSTFGKGFRGEQLFCKIRDDENCNIKLDNFTSMIDVFDKEYCKVQVKTVSLSLEYGKWKANDINKNCDTVVIICMDNDFKNVLRVYIISRKYIAGNNVTITESASSISKWKTFRLDECEEKLYNDIYHDMKIEDCPVLKTVN